MNAYAGEDSSSSAHMARLEHEMYFIWVTTRMMFVSLYWDQLDLSYI